MTMLQSRPDISFVIAAYNAQDTISRAIKSALAQVDVTLEVLVVDDCSSDATVKTAEQIDDPRVTVIRQQSNGGPARARNRGMDDLELQTTSSVGGGDMGNLSTLLAWHRAFPPAEAERERNHKVDTLYQGNRNPFIDDPLLADRVFSGDAPFAAWRRPHFTTAELGLASVSGDVADPDGDGLPNLLEFAFNLAPRSADAVAATTLTLLAPATPGGPTSFSLAHRRHRHATDVTIRYEVSPDLATWTVVTPTTTNTLYLDALTDRVTITVPAEGARRFIRVRATRTAP